MASRLELHIKLKEILGSESVYYQPPSSVQMTYPAIVYSRSRIDNIFACDIVYGQANAYQVTVIAKQPDHEAVGKVSRLPKCSFNTHFTKDNLNHDVFTLYY